MKRNFLKALAMAMVLALLMLCCSCTRIKCKAEQISCEWDCPETIGLKQACEQKCNLLYDVCRNK